MTGREEFLVVHLDATCSGQEARLVNPRHVMGVFAPPSVGMMGKARILFVGGLFWDVEETVEDLCKMGCVELKEKGD